MKGDATPFDVLLLPFVRVSDEVKDARLTVCHDCEHLNEFSQCRLCGCLMPLKARVPKASCPVGKWGREQGR